MWALTTLTITTLGTILGDGGLWRYAVDGGASGEVGASSLGALALMAAVVGSTMGAVGALARWALALVEQQKAARSGKSFNGTKRNGAEWTSEDELLLRQVHAAATRSSERLETLAVALDSRLNAFLSAERENAKAIQSLANEVRALRLDLAAAGGAPRYRGSARGQPPAADEEG